MISICFSQFFGKILPYLGGGAVYCVGSPKTQILALIRGGGAVWYEWYGIKLCKLLQNINLRFTQSIFPVCANKQMYLSNIEISVQTIMSFIW